MKQLLLRATISCYACLAFTAAAEIERTLDGKPNLSGYYDSSSLTPLNRPRRFGGKLFMTRAEAEAIEQRAAAGKAYGDRRSDPNRGAPVEGGDGNNRSGAGGVGGYNSFWIDNGTKASEIGGKFRTSIIYDPPDGRQPKRTSKGAARAADNASSFRHQNDGTASWLKTGSPGPFDNPEDLALAERCLLGFSAGPPMLPGLYNNFKKIVQTPTHVMILVEMVHDARIIRLNAHHNPDLPSQWLGDSVGHWEGDTLVIETRNFKPHTGLSGGDENLHLTERLRLMSNGNLIYDFTVNDLTAWVAPWSGEYVWQASDDQVYEYACHEGNYAMGNILRGARLLEAEEEGTTQPKQRNASTRAEVGS